MKILYCAITATLLLSLILLTGCSGLLLDELTRYRATAISDSAGDATLDFYDGSETVNIRNSATDTPLRGIETLGMRSDSDRLYVVADPNRAFHPAITSGETNAYGNTRIYMTPVDQHTGSNSTSYHTVYGGLLWKICNDYAANNISTTVSGMRNSIATEAWGKAAGLVVCATEPINSYTGDITTTQIAQRSSNLSTAFQAIGWSNIYSSYGFSSSARLNLWVIDPAQLQISSNSSGALSDTLVLIVAPVSSSTGTPIAGALRTELTWNAAVDLDLHLVRDYADLYDADNDCYWHALEQNWGDFYRTDDNPRLLYDNSSGNGPETIVMEQMTSGETYSVVVDYWGDPSGNPISRTVTATVKVWTQSRSTPVTFTVTGLNHGAPNTGDYRIVCDIDGRTGQVTAANRSINRSVSRAAGQAVKR